MSEDIVTRLQAFLDGTSERCTFADVREASATIAALRAEVERLEKDAGRYRVLRSLLAGDAPMIREAQRIIDSDYVWQMDEKLDAAIAQTKERA